MDLQRELDDLLAELWSATRILPVLNAERGAGERARMVEVLARGERPVPERQRGRPTRLDPRLWRKLDRARALAEHALARALYVPRLDEMELDLALVGALGDPKAVRPIVRRRYGSGASKVPAAWCPIGAEERGIVSLASVAERILDGVEPSAEPRTIPADAPVGRRSLAQMVRLLADRVGLTVTTRIDPRLVANAAAGGQTVFIAPRFFGEREAQRIAVHEVFGHVVAGANGREQRLRILELGTARSFEDQEGVALWWEEATGLMDGSRLRTLAGRVLAADWMHAGLAFGEVARNMMRHHHFSADESVSLAERAFRGGGVARDVGYLWGWLRVRAAIRTRRHDIGDLQVGKVSVDDLGALRGLITSGQCHRARFVVDAWAISEASWRAPVRRAAGQGR